MVGVGLRLGSCTVGVLVGAGVGAVGVAVGVAVGAGVGVSATQRMIKIEQKMNKK